MPGMKTHSLESKCDDDGGCSRASDAAHQTNVFQIRTKYVYRCFMQRCVALNSHLANLSARTPTVSLSSNTSHHRLQMQFPNATAMQIRTSFHACNLFPATFLRRRLGGKRRISFRIFVNFFFRFFVFGNVIEFQYLHCVICSTIRRHCILVHRFDFVAKGLWWSSYNLRMRFLHAGLHFAMTVTVSLRGREEKENRWIIAKRLFRWLKTRHSMSGL